MITPALLWLALALWITGSGSRTLLKKCDCILVLGARSLADGTPGPSFLARCQKAVELWRAGWAPRIFFTGGKGDSGSIEGLVGVNFARAQGLPESDLFYENQSHTTRENFYWAAWHMRSRGWNSCLVVTDPFHEPRSLALAQEYGLTAYPAPTFEGPSCKRPGSWAYYTARETLAWMKYWLQ